MTEKTRYQVSGLFEISAENWDEALEAVKNSGLKPISINIMEVVILPKDDAKKD